MQGVGCREILYALALNLEPPTFTIPFPFYPPWIPPSLSGPRQTKSKSDLRSDPIPCHPPVFSYGFAKARKPGRFAWHHEAVISPRIRREEAPRRFRRMKNPSTFPTISRPMLPARITLAPGPELRCGRSAKREGDCRSCKKSPSLVYSVQFCKKGA